MIPRCSQTFLKFDGVGNCEHGDRFTRGKLNILCLSGSANFHAGGFDWLFHFALGAGLSQIIQLISEVFVFFLDVFAVLLQQFDLVLIQEFGSFALSAHADPEVGRVSMLVRSGDVGLDRELFDIDVKRGFGRSDDFGISLFSELRLMGGFALNQVSDAGSLVLLCLL